MHECILIVIADTLKFVQVSNKIKEVLTFRSAELHKKNMMMYKNESQECCACVLQNLKAESIFFKKIYSKIQTLLRLSISIKILCHFHTICQCYKDFQLFPPMYNNVKVVQFILQFIF